MFFEVQGQSGGGPIEKIYFVPQEKKAVITYRSAEGKEYFNTVIFYPILFLSFAYKQIIEMSENHTDRSSSLTVFVLGQSEFYTYWVFPISLSVMFNNLTNYLTNS